MSDQYPIQPYQGGFFAPISPSSQIPRREEWHYVTPGQNSTEAGLVVYNSLQRLDFLPKVLGDFQALSRGQLPSIISQESAPDPVTLEMFYALLHSMEKPQAWHQLFKHLEELGKPPRSQRIDFYVTNHHDERFLILNVSLDFGGESGKLILQPLGRRSRGRYPDVDIEDAYGIMWPLLLYHPSFGRSVTISPTDEEKLRILGHPDEIYEVAKSLENDPGDFLLWQKLEALSSRVGAHIYLTFPLALCRSEGLAGNYQDCAAELIDIVRPRAIRIFYTMKDITGGATFRRATLNLRRIADLPVEISVVPKTEEELRRSDMLRRLREN